MHIVCSMRPSTTILAPIPYQLKICTMIPKIGSRSVIVRHPDGKCFYNVKSGQWIGLWWRIKKSVPCVVGCLFHKWQHRTWSTETVTWSHGNYFDLWTENVLLSIGNYGLKCSGTLFWVFMESNLDERVLKSFQTDSGVWSVTISRINGK